MKIITRKLLAKRAANRWYMQYCNRGVWDSRMLERSKETKEDIYNKLLSLGDDPNPDDIDKVIGNHSWTWVYCNECDERVEGVVQLGEEPDYESNTANVCFGCLNKASMLVNEHKD